MEFITPPNHFGFQAKKIYGTPIKGTLTNCSIAYIEPQGGGPKPEHKHSHNHFFILTEGEATIYEDEKKIIVRKEEAVYINGQKIHTILNESNQELKMIGITIE